jgi:hypothetical protein
MKVIIDWGLHKEVADSYYGHWTYYQDVYNIDTDDVLEARNKAVSIINQINSEGSIHIKRVYTDPMEPIKLEDVVSVYSGKPGCCCGCNGKHTTPEESMRTVKLMTNKMNKRIAEGLEVGIGSRYYEYETENRLWLVYVREL